MLIKQRYAKFLSLTFIFFSSSCTVSSLENHPQDLSLTKQKQRINFLQKKLQLAEKDLKKTEEEVECLTEELSLAKLNLTSKLVDELEEDIFQNPKKWKGSSGRELFLKERESLHEMIQTSSYSFEAQLLLDKILQIITTLSEEKGEG